MHEEAVSRYVEQQILSFGASLVGFADLRGVAPPAFSRWCHAVSIAVALDEAMLASVRTGPTREYYQEYQRVNRLLDEIASQSANLIAALGYRAEAFPATIVDRSMGGEFERTLSVGFQHKTAATRAGLGWIGKSALLVTPQYGPRVRLATVFTDMPVDARTPIVSGQCGECGTCVARCPAGAIKGREWSVGVARDGLLDARACRAKVRQLLWERVGTEDTVCGVCVQVCPRGAS